MSGGVLVWYTKATYTKAGQMNKVGETGLKSLHFNVENCSDLQ